MAPNFEKYVQDGNRFVNEIATELGLSDDRSKAYRILKSVLHVLRDKISPQESLQMIAQLPMFIKAVYVDGWKLNEKGRKLRSIDDFVNAVTEVDGMRAYFDLTRPGEAENAVRVVFKVLQRHVSEGEISDIVAILPKELRSLFV